MLSLCRSESCKVISLYLFASLDIDECSADTNPCDKNAICANNIGSYSCTCKQGFTGNGTTCEGSNDSSIFLVHVFSEGVLLFFDQRVLKRFLSISLSFRIDIDDSSADTNPFDVRGSCLFRSK